MYKFGPPDTLRAEKNMSFKPREIRPVCTLTVVKNTTAALDFCLRQNSFQNFPRKRCNLSRLKRVRKRPVLCAPALDYTMARSFHRVLKTSTFARVWFSSEQSVADRSTKCDLRLRKRPRSEVIKGALETTGNCSSDSTWRSTHYSRSSNSTLHTHAIVFLLLLFVLMFVRDSQYCFQAFDLFQSEE